MKATLFVSAVCLSTSFAWCQSAESYQLTRKVRPGQSFVYDVEMSFMQGGAEIKLLGKATESVMSVQDGKIVLERKLTDLKAIISDQTVNVSEGDAQNMKFADIARSIVTSQVTGEITNIQKNRTRSVDYAFAMATNAIVGYDYVKIGDAWSRKIDQSGAPRMDFQYKADRLETIQGDPSIAIALKGTQAQAKDGVDATGTIWLSTITGMATKTDVLVKNLPLGEKGERVDVRLVQNLRKN